MDKDFDLLYELRIYKDNSDRYAYQLSTNRFGPVVNILDNDLDDIPNRLHKHLVAAKVFNETKDDDLTEVKIKINISKNFESAVEGFMAYYGFIKSDKASDGVSSTYTWTRVSTDIDVVWQMLVDQLGAIIQAKGHTIGAFIGLAIRALSALPGSNEMENDYFHTVSDGLGVACLRISVTKDSDDL